MVGRRFGRLTVLNREPNRGRKLFWKCRCDCGSFNTVDATALRSGDTQSCGCFRLERVSAASRKHGHSFPKQTPEYKAWRHAIARCENPNDKKYIHYGARGISMCQEWRHDFLAFYAHVGDRPAGTTLGRIDNNLGYEPGNVRWETYVQQNNNRRPFKKRT